MTLPAQELVRLAMYRLDAKGNSDLARMLGLGVHGDQRVRRWLDGENEPEYKATMKLLELLDAVDPKKLEYSKEEMIRRAEDLKPRVREARRSADRGADV
jgi:hypothetical protein